jgi:ribosomal protein S18 acetylase RimI-like enzyme
MITIRKSTEADIDFISKHAYRLIEFGPPAWRDANLMTAADIRYNIAAIRSNDPDVGTFIAIDAKGERCGFIYLHLDTDYYTKEKYAHISDIVVSKEAEGKGVAKLLMQKADEWAREKKVPWITLNVFANNTHAQEVYEKLGYQKEWVKYIKLLD